MRVPIFNIKQVNTIYHDTSMKKDLIYWMINPCNSPIEAINSDQKFSISLVLMCDQNKLLSIVSVPSEDKIYFEDLDKGVFVIEGLIKKRFNPPVSSLSAMAKPISEEDQQKYSGRDNPNTHYWLG